MTLSRPIEGNVARILNSREVALNRGAEDGVTEGMIFDVLDPKSEDITDPITGEVLGSVYRPKVQVRVYIVEPRLALARTFKSERVNVGGSGVALGLARAFEPPKWVERHETLRTDESTWEDLDEEESYVKTGDPVIEVVLGEAAEESGSRTLEASEAGSAFERSVAKWLAEAGWDVRPAEGVDVGIDLEASRGDERIAVEAKWSHRPLSASVVAQAVGFLLLSERDPNKKYDSLYLVVGEPGLTDTAKQRAAGIEKLKIFRKTDDTTFDPVT